MTRDSDDELAVACFFVPVGENIYIYIYCYLFLNIVYLYISRVGATRHPDDERVHFGLFRACGREIYIDYFGIMYSSYTIYLFWNIVLY